jgi:hypothetical protein
MPEPHILLMVVQPTPSGKPAPSAAWRAGAWPWPCRQHVAHDDFLHVVRFESCALDGGLDRRGAELRRAHVLQVALERAHRSARGAYDNYGVIHRRILHLVSSNNSRPISMRRISDVPAPIS